MNRKVFLAMVLGLSVLIGSPYQGHTACLMDCEEGISGSERQETNERDSRSDEARRDERTQQFGNIRDSMILRGVVMKSKSTVSVGSNSGDVKTSSTNVIQGINKSHNNTSNTTNTSRR